ncbi:MAG TPA: DUF4956 domain-containing protein [Kofleriaceae bacterium]|nr:DUF4956 domain-containing protein [Kofleriaceae bacterium]
MNPTDHKAISDSLQGLLDLSAAIPPEQIAVSLGLSLALSLAIATTYRVTHRGVSYSQTYAHTLVIMCMVITVIMLIVGSSIARAFSLVGAMSIIRFRNAVKETKDIGFIFLVISIGMACGARFYTLAAIASFLLCTVILLLFRANMFGKAQSSRILCVRMPADRDHEGALNPVFSRYLDDSNLISMESVGGGTLQELVYSVVLKRTAEPRRLIESLRGVNENQKVSLVLGQQEVDL